MLEPKVALEPLLGKHEPRHPLHDRPLQRESEHEEADAAEDARNARVLVHQERVVEDAERGSQDALGNLYKGKLAR